MSDASQSLTRSGTLSALALAYLRESPVAHELLLGLWEQKPSPHACAWWVLSSNGRVLGVASFRPPTSLIFSRMSIDAARVLAGALRPFAEAVKAVHAPRELELLCGHILGLTAPERSYVLKLAQVTKGETYRGSLLCASELHRPWVRGMIRACLKERRQSGAASLSLDYWVACKAIYLWRDASGELVALALQNRRHPWGTCLGLIYTKPEHRRRGYAKEMVRQVCARLFRQGHSLVFLHADPGPRLQLYRDLGFEAVQELVSWKGRASVQSDSG